MHEKINIVTPVFPPYKAGIGSVALSSAKILQTLGYKVQVFVPNYAERKTVQENFDGILVHRIKPVVQYGNAAYIPKISSYLDAGSLVHLHYPFFGGAEILYVMRKRKKIKLIVHYHMDVLGSGWLKGFFFLYKKLFLPKILRVADRIIVTSFDYAKHSDISKYFESHRQKFIEIPNGVNAEVFVPFNQKTKNQKPKTKNILFVGGLDKAHYFKGLHFLIESMKRIKDAQLIIVGDGDMKDEYVLQVQKSFLQDRIHFAGSVSQQQLVGYYQSCSVCVLPSIDKSEAFGVVLIEANACAKPVIASDLAGVRSVVKEGVNGYLVKPGDVFDLTEKIQTVLNNPELARTMGERSRRRAEEKYSWEKIGAQLNQLYKSL